MSKMKARQTNPTLQTPVWKWLVITCVVVAAIIAGVIGSLKPNSNVTLTDLNNIDDLRTRFNQDKGTTRLLLLVSPT
jgi:type VI protein secretion system component VasF